MNNINTAAENEHYDWFVSIKNTKINFISFILVMNAGKQSGRN